MLVTEYGDSNITEGSNIVVVDMFMQPKKHEYDKGTHVGYRRLRFQLQRNQKLKCVGKDMQVRNMASHWHFCAGFPEEHGATRCESYFLCLISGMLREMEMRVRVAIPTKSLDRNGVVPQTSVITCLLKELLVTKSTEEHGYFLAVTKLKSIGNGEIKEESRDILFPVAFRCRTFLPVKGEIMFGVVHKIYRGGVFLRSGPMEYIYLPAQKMPKFSYVRWKSQESFIGDDLSRIENDVVIRFVVFAVRWRKKHWDIEREFMILASLEGDCLGPVSLPVRSDELEL